MLVVAVALASGASFAEDEDRAEARARYHEARYEIRAAREAEREVTRLESAEARAARHLVLESEAKKAAESKAAEKAHEEMQRINYVEAEKNFKAEDKDMRKLRAAGLRAEARGLRAELKAELKAERREARAAKQARADEQAAWATAQVEANRRKATEAAKKAKEELVRTAESAVDANRSSDRRRSGAVGSPEAVARAKEMLLRADAAFFDVDSTVVKTEGIDLLGKCFGVMEEIAALTHEAMNGNVRFQDAMAERLRLMADHGMNRYSLEKCVQQEGKPRWTHGVRNVVKLLHKRGAHVYLVSGGFKNMLYPIAAKLSIPRENVYANEILFDEDGAYAGFDRSNPTSASGGKPKVLKMMKRKHGYKTMVMFGDGVTDMDARTPGAADAFVGYGGVADREAIREGADWFVYSFKEVVAVLKGKDS